MVFDHTKTKFSETIPSKLDKVSDLISDIVKKLDFLPWDDLGRSNVKLCLQEAVVNAIKHGNKCDEKKKVKIEFSVEKDGLIIEVTDQGDGFDIKTLSDPTYNDNLGKLQGRGIFVIYKLMKKVESTNSGRTIRMTMQLKKKEGRED